MKSIQLELGGQTVTLERDASGRVQALGYVAADEEAACILSGERNLIADFLQLLEKEQPGHLSALKTALKTEFETAAGIESPMWAPSRFWLLSAAWSDDAALREAAARHVQSPEAALVRLARDQMPGIRTLVAERAQLPESVLAILLRDPEPLVLSRLARPDAPLALRGVSPSVRLELG